MKTSMLTPARLLAVALPVLFLVSCKPGTTDNAKGPSVNPPLMTDVPFQNFDIDAQGGDTVRLTDGTSIYIPQSIFIDQNGKPVTGKVQLHYRAFYTPGEIVASGISMLYDTAGTEHNFSSAGMFEITGTQDGKPVSIAPGKSISMDFASSYNDLAFSFYNLDTVAHNWNFLCTTKADSNELKKQLLSALASEPRKPVQPRQYDPKQPVINIDVDPKDHPELSGYSNIMWQYAGTGNDPEKNAWIYDNDWTSVKLQMIDTNTCTYQMNMSGNGKNFSTDVYPSLRGDNYTRSMDSYKKELLAFEATERDRQEKRTRAAQIKDFERKLKITNWGFYNCDVFAAYGVSPGYANVKFNFDDPDFAKHPEDVLVYASIVDNRMVIDFTGDYKGRMLYAPSKATRLIAILKGTSKACVLNSEDFRMRVRPETIETELQLHAVKDPVASSKDYDALLGKL